MEGWRRGESHFHPPTHNHSQSHNYASHQPRRIQKLVSINEVSFPERGGREKACHAHSPNNITTHEYFAPLFMT